MASHFSHLHNMPHNTPYPKTDQKHWLRYNNTVPLLNSVKILTVQSRVDNGEESI